MNLIIEATNRCKYCHPETCLCPDYQLMLNGNCIASGDFDRVSKVKQIVEQAVAKAVADATCAKGQQ